MEREHEPPFASELVTSKPPHEQGDGMSEQRYVYVVIVTAWSDGGPLLGLYSDAWDAIRVLRSRYQDKLYETPVSDLALADGIVFNADVMGAADTRVLIQRRPIVPAS